MSKVLLTLLLLLSTNCLLAQTIRVTGTIVDQDGKPIPGANVLQKGTPNGVATNWGGDFEISVPKGQSILLIAYIGYKTFELAIEASDSTNPRVEVTLVRDSKKNKKIQSSGKVIEETVIHQ